MTLGSIIARLSDETLVQETLLALDDLALLARVQGAAAAAGEPLASFAGAAVGRFVAEADDEAWLSLVTAASRAADPAAACLRRMLAFSLAGDGPAAAIAAAPAGSRQDRSP
jgi:hypothetical protein